MLFGVFFLISQPTRTHMLTSDLTESRSSLNMIWTSCQHMSTSEVCTTFQLRGHGCACASTLETAPLQHLNVVQTNSVTMTRIQNNSGRFTPCRLRRLLTLVAATSADGCGRSCFASSSPVTWSFSGDFVSASKETSTVHPRCQGMKHSSGQSCGEESTTF